MTIEVRQLLIRSQVNTAPASPAPADRADREREWERVKEEVLAECKAWLAQKLLAARER
jgi:hypothetical protein